MKRAVIRADGSSQLGLGHIIRSLAFADGLGAVGVESLFATKILGTRIADMIQARGYALREIPPQGTSVDDAERTLAIAGREGASLIVTDICHRSSLRDVTKLVEYHRTLADGSFTVAFTGGDVTELPVQISVFPYYRREFEKPTADAERVVLLGPSYAIFDREFREASRLDRRIATEGHRVLVSIGGGDSMGLTAKVVSAVGALSGDDLALWIILGPAFSDELRSEVQGLLVDFRGELTLSDDHPNMPEAMLWADLAVTGDGLTKYETAVTGTPSIMLSRSDSPEALNEEFASAGTTRHVGDGGLIDVEDLSREIRALLGDRDVRRSMSQKGKALVDGLGLERIISRLPPEVLS